MGPGVGIGIPGGTSGELGPPDGYVAWWRADDITGVADGADITNWTDRTGTYTLTQSTAASKPHLRSAASEFNGRPVVDFNGSSHTMSVASASDFQLGGARTIVAVYDCNSGAGSTLLSKWDTQEWLLNGDAAGVCRLTVRNATDTGNFTVDSVTDPDDTAAHIAVAEYDGGTNTLMRFDSDAKQTTGSVTVRTAADVVYLGSLNGSTNFHAGSIAEVIVYTKSLSAAEVATLSTYYNARYGKNVALAS